MNINVTPFEMRDVILLQRHCFSDGRDRIQEYYEGLRAIGLHVPVPPEITFKVVRR